MAQLQSLTVLHDSSFGGNIEIKKGGLVIS